MIGAVAVIDGEILLEDSIEVMCKLDYNRAPVTVHGITRDETLGGIEEEAALNVAYEKHAGFELRNRSLDTMDLALHLNDDGAFGNQPMAQGFSLDVLCDMFQIPAHDRHTAGGDAFITAQLFLRLLRAARQAGRGTLAAVAEAYAGGAGVAGASRLQGLDREPRGEAPD